MSATPRPLGPRAQARERTMERIVELGKLQLLEQGAAELSVREIARGLGMVSSAIYRYVGSRDELLTLLIVDAFGDLADAVDAALAHAGPAPREQFLALARAMVRWALEHPERWTLLYGTPVRGYSAPAETTNQAGTRVIGRVLEIAGVISLEQPPPVGPEPPAEIPAEIPAEVEALLAATLAEFGIEAQSDAVVRAITAWSSLIGVISAHLFGQLGGDAVAVGEQLLEVQCRCLAGLVSPR